MILVGAYVLVIGAPAPAVRSAVMLGVSATCRLVQRNTSPWAALAIGGGAPLIAPRTVLDLGWQLSVIGMAGLVASGALARRWIGSQRGEWRGRLAAALLASAGTAAEVWTFRTGFVILRYAFYAAVEERYNPALRGLPVVVGADPNGGKGRGVVTTANYMARRFGITSPISTYPAMVLGSSEVRVLDMTRAFAAALERDPLPVG